MAAYDDMVRQARVCFKLLYDKYKEVHNPVVFLPLFAGIGPYKILSSNPMAGDIHNVHAVVDGVHAYYKRTNDETIPLLYHDIIVKLISCASSSSNMRLIENIIEYDIYLKNNNRCAFDVDCDSLMTELKSNCAERNIIM